jgi:hypothetical protein
MAVVAGAVAVLTGTLVYFDGFSKTTDQVLFPISSILFTVWVGAMGYKLWQKTSQPAATVGP